MNKTQPQDSPGTSFKADFLKRVRATKTTRWWRFGIVAAIFIAWVVWLGNWWPLLLLPLLFDIYITGYIPFTWWKKSKSKTVVMVMSWIDAIIYALILVYFAFTFIGQNYQIPSSSLEKTLLTGDYLWVNKMAYGPRVPMTPIHFPLVQNTMPVFNTRSYIEWPRWKYHRLAGFGKVKAGDIVVFNFPAGDTVAVLQQNPDYYTLKKYIADGILSSDPKLNMRIAAMSEHEAEAARDQIARTHILSNLRIFGEVLYRPVDRRENYVKRAVGLPGQTLEIVDGRIMIDGAPQPWPAEAQFNYYIQTSAPLTDLQWEQIGVAADDRQMLSPEGGIIDELIENGFDLSGARPSYFYCVPLTDGMLKALKATPGFINATRQPAPRGEYLFPDKISADWTRADYGPVAIPAKGTTIRLTPENWPMYERIIRNYENHPQSYVRDSQVYVDGRPADTYTFMMDYYFMMGDNRDNSLDSRYWGFVPEDHIVGRPERVLISFDKDKSIFNGGIRWNRILKNANPGF